MKSDLKFGTSGLRGLVTDLSDVVVQRYSRAFIRYLEANNKIKPGSSIAVGYDLRESSPHIAHIVLSACLDAGYKSINLGTLPTPALALFSRRHKIPAIMVTGSHIPEDRNGLKFYSKDGEIDKQDEAGILSHLDPQSRIEPTRPLPPVILYNDYLMRCLELLPIKALAGKRIGIYQHSSVARDLMKTIITTMGAEAFILAPSDHFIPVDTEALSDEDRHIAQEGIKVHQLDGIISTDGDGDRPLLADEMGHYFHGDLLGIFTAQYLRADCVVTPVTSTSMVEQLFDNVKRCRVGSPYVIEAMAETRREGFKRIVGFEANGGVLLGNTIRLNGNNISALPTRDAMLPILATLGLSLAKQMPLSALRQTLPHRFNASDRLQNIDMEKAAHLLESLKDKVQCARFFAPLGSIATTDTIDGLRIIFDNHDMIHFRPSGNAPEFRIYSEADSDARAQALREWGLETLQKQLG